MAKQVGHIMINLVSDSSGDFAMAGQKFRYVVTESGDPTLQKDSGEVTLDTLSGGDTITTWLAAVKQQVKDDEGIA